MPIMHQSARESEKSCSSPVASTPIRNDFFHLSRSNQKGVEKTHDFFYVTFYVPLSTVIFLCGSFPPPPSRHNHPIHTTITHNNHTANRLKRP
jgi:hypothetical protein